jgi:hypothetical protein
LIKLTAVERAEIVDAARRGAKRCRDAMINLRFSDPQHKIEMHQELEEIARMWVTCPLQTEPRVSLGLPNLKEGHDAAEEAFG